MRLDTLINDHPRPTRCSMGNALAKLATVDQELHADLQDWLDGDRHESDRQIWEALQALHYRVGQQQIGHHRRGTCGCSK